LAPRQNQQQSPEKPARRPQQRRSEATRRQILTGAEELFARTGYAGASLGVLADEVGIHKPGIFYYFPNKRALYEAAVGEAVGSLEEGLTAILVSDRSPENRVLDAAAAWVDFLSARPTLVRLLLHEAANPDSSAMPAVFSEVGQRIQVLMSAAIREIQPELPDDDLFHYFSLVTGTTLFYASAMQRFLSSGDDAALGHSMERHKQLLLHTSREFLRRLDS
jgi:AcrR family transcriptional regulator